MQDSSPVQDSFPMQDSTSSSKRIRVDFDLENLPSDPGLRQKISSYHPNNHDEIRRHYLTKGPCQPVLHDFPVSYFSEKPYRFRSDWYMGRRWLEYSIEKDAAFCFYCYLFGRQDVGKQGGGETFVTKGFKLWNQVAKLDSHVGGVNSAHSQAVQKAFHGHDESQGSSDKGNFLELVQFLEDHNESINEVLQIVPKNCMLTHPDIQKNIVNAIARETSEAIIKDLDNGFFSILVDESRDISVKEQMSLVLRYVNKKGIIIERFLGIVHVAITVVGGSCKRRDAFRDAQFAKIKEDLENGVRRSGQGLNQETNLKRPGDTLWGSYYGTILNLILMFSAVVDVLEIIEEDGLSNPKVEARSIMSGRSRRNTQQKTNLHYYRVELFYTVIDMQLQELNNRFSEANTDLLLCMACLNPSNSFVAFDKEKLLRLAKFYPSDFLRTNILALDSQLQNYIFDMHSNDFFLELQGISELAEKLVSTRKHETYPLVYLLVKLALTLPVATATVERSFSAMKYIKNELRNQMGDQ
ncbi:uncharacterized protein LOC126721833 [Quercus robur]|uniref:uncharacterized protein LOC126721833 n=1 Tax=Quercus robur TaxID=38942 RepID=UPI002162B3F1|nr:uncharacterized protein LOC126721833 [Quercus robur]